MAEQVTFKAPESIEETVREVAGLKAATRVAIRGAMLLGPAISNQVAALYELAGYDEGTADVMAAGITARANTVAELLEQIRQELTAVGQTVAAAYQVHEEYEAKRKVTAAKAGVRTGSRASTAKLDV